MAVNWSWKYPIGYVIFWAHDHKHKCKINIYQGNCLGVLIYDFKEFDEEQNKVVEKYTFQGFWDDIHHLRRCLGLEKSYHAWSRDEQTLSNIYDGDIVSIHLNAFEKDGLLIAKEFARAKFKKKIRVELYWKKLPC